MDIVFFKYYVLLDYSCFWILCFILHIPSTIYEVGTVRILILYLRTWGLEKS